MFSIHSYVMANINESMSNVTREGGVLAFSRWDNRKVNNCENGDDCDNHDIATIVTIVMIVTERQFWHFDNCKNCDNCDDCGNCKYQIAVDLEGMISY